VKLTTLALASAFALSSTLHCVTIQIIHRYRVRPNTVRLQNYGRKRQRRSVLRQTDQQGGLVAATKSPYIDALSVGRRVSRGFLGHSSIE